MKRQELPEWIGEFLSYEEAERIEDAVRDVEQRTSAEIVPMIVRRSTMKATGDRIIFWICFGLFGVGGATWLAFAGGVDEALLSQIIERLGLWPAEWVYRLLAALAETLVAGVMFLIAWFVAQQISGLDWLHRFVFPPRDQALQVEHRAQAEFFASDLRSTSGRTGVLVFVSLLEHRAVILADEAISSKLDREVWKSTLETLVKAIANGEMARGYVASVGIIGRMLEPLFPPGDRNPNELEDRLRIKE
jgi:putative membrane protein